MPDAAFTARVTSLADTERLGQCLAKHLPESACLVLTGTLGAGKTRLAQALIGAFDIPVEEILSPTYSLIRTYQTPSRTIHHMDAYRLADEDEFLELGVDELLDQPSSLCLVEWGERVRSVLPHDALAIVIDWQDENLRNIHLTGSDCWAGMFERIRACYLHNVHERSRRK